jgi:hypothetical protein
VSNATLFITLNARLKALGLEIEKNISIPWIRRNNEEHGFIGKGIAGINILIGMGKITN